MNTPYDPTTIHRPDPRLFHYYILTSLLAGPLSPVVLLPLWFRYWTLRYTFDDSGVSMQSGFLFRKEVQLTYRRIQDIHLTRNLLQRWMGLAKISLQTASGGSQAELVVEGILEPEQLRDFLYSKMRGAKNEMAAGQQPAVDQALAAGTATNDSQRVTIALEGIRDSLQTLASRTRDGDKV